MKQLSNSPASYFDYRFDQSVPVTNRVILRGCFLEPDKLWLVKIQSSGRNLPVTDYLACSADGVIGGHDTMGNSTSQIANRMSYAEAAFPAAEQATISLSSRNQNRVDTAVEESINRVLYLKGFELLWYRPYSLLSTHQALEDDLQYTVELNQCCVESYLAT